MSADVGGGDAAANPEGSTARSGRGRRTRRQGLGVESIGDVELLGTWQMFRDAVGALDVRLNGMLNDGADASLVVEALVRLTSAGPAGIPVSQLANGLGLPTGGATKFVDRLQDRGLVRRRRSEADRRVVTVELTPAGRAEADRSSQAFTEALRAQLAGVGVQRLRALHAVCAEIEPATRIDD